MTPVTLAPQLDMNAATPLAKELTALRGQPISLDGSQVERLGALCLQVLLASRETWRVDSQAFEIREPSPALQDAAALMGADLFAS